MAAYMFWQYRISMAFLLAFQVLFLRLKRKPALIAASVGLCFALTWIIDYYGLYRLSPGHVTLLCTFLDTVLVQTTAFVLSRDRDFRVLFTGITAADYVMIGNVLSSAIYVHTRASAPALIAQAAAHGCVLLIFYVHMRRNYLASMDLENVPWGRLCLIPASVYAGVYSITVAPSNVYDEPGNLVGAGLFLGLMVLAYIMLFTLAARNRREAELKNDCDFLAASANGLRREAELQQASEERVAELRHDMRHNMVLIDAYLDADEPELIRALTASVNTALDGTVTRRFCENVTLNGILANAARSAEKRQVPFSCEATVPPELRINEFELAAVVANLVENAINAAAELPPAQRSVTVRIRQVLRQLVIETTNSYEGTISFSKESGLPRSEKGDGHGYGLRSVQSFARKNGALFSCDLEDGRFVVRLLLDF